MTGDLTESGVPREYEQALGFLTGLRVLLGLEANRLIIVPGPRDVNKKACEAYFTGCEADDVRPTPPYWPKWKHFASLFKELYQGLDGTIFDTAQPWTLFELPELRTVVAGLNSTIAMSHRAEDDYGLVGKAQAAWFAERLRPHGDRLRIGVIAHPPDRLRDSESLQRLLGSRLDLLVHGHDPRDGATEEVWEFGGRPCVPALAPGHHQLIEITPEGLRRWTRGGGRDPLVTGRPQILPYRLLRRPGASPAPPEPAEDAPGEPTQADDPAARLLDRIIEVCRARFERAKIRRVDGDPPYLLVTHAEDGFVRQFLIGAHAGAVTREQVETFLSLVHTIGLEHGSELVYQGPTPPQALRNEALRRGLRLRSFTEFQGLLDLSDHVAKQTRRLNADRRYPPELYVPQRFRFRELGRSDGAIRDDLTGELMRLLAGDHGRFILLLGDFGTGKTFAMRELARRIPSELPHLTPLLIELRNLDKSQAVDSLVASHLTNHGEELIDVKAFHYMLRQGRIVLLLDGFDELVTRVTYERAADHLDTLLQAAEDKAKIVVAARTQHFQSRGQVMTALGERVERLPTHRVLSIEGFTTEQIRAFLVNRYGSQQAADDRMTLLGGISNLLDLASNPRMLSFIADLPEERVRAVAQAGGTISAASLYQEILDHWLRHEESRTRLAGAPGGLTLDELWRAVTTLAVRLWKTGETYLERSELDDVAATLLTELTDDEAEAGARMSVGQTVHAIGSGSLLVRTDEGLFGFIHESVAEWLVARHLAHHLKELSLRPLSELTIEFLCDLAKGAELQAWAARTLASPDAGVAARANALKVTNRLRTAARTDLRGALLRGEDLSHRDLSGVDLTGADLTEAQLVRANLERAVLRNARLIGARLDNAKLAGADLTGADLTRARLMRADVRDVVITGSRWDRAAVIDATGVPDGAPELYGAAIAPRPDTDDQVEVQVAPQSVGVQSGFHDQPVRLPEPVAYRPDGGVFAVGGDDGGVLICEAATGNPLRTLRGHRGRVYKVAYGSAGLLTGASDGTVRIWDPHTGEMRHVLQGNPNGAWPVALFGDLVAAGGADGVVRVWSAGELMLELRGHTPPINGAVFLRGRLITGDADGTIRVWDLSTGKVRHELRGHSGALYRLVLSPERRLLAAGDGQGVLCLWDPYTGELLHRLTGHPGGICAIAFHPDGHALVSGDTEGTVRLWDPHTGQLMGTLSGHEGAIYHVAFSPSGELFVTGDSEGVVRVWSASGEQLAELSGHRGSVWPFAFHPKGHRLVTSSSDGMIRLWDPRTGRCRRVLRGHGRRINSVAFSADGRMLAACGSDGYVRLWDPQTGRRIRSFTGTGDRLESAVFSPAGSLLATTSNDGGVYLWDPTSDGYARELNVDTDHVWAQAFTPDGTRLATANDDDSVRVWHRASGRQELHLTEHRGRVRSIAFSPDGRLIVTGCDDRIVRLWDMVTGECTATLSGHKDRVYAVAFHPSGELVASASNDGTARLWRVPSGDCLHVLEHGGGRLWTAAFSPDGNLLATAGDDLAIRLWDPARGVQLHALTGHTKRISSVAFHPSGELLASAGDDGLVILWDLAGPRQRATLLGLPEGWAAFTPTGLYKSEGEVAGQFWYVIDLCRFEPGELDGYLPGVRRLRPEEVLS